MRKEQSPTHPDVFFFFFLSGRRYIDTYKSKRVNSGTYLSFFVYLGSEVGRVTMSLQSIQVNTYIQTKHLKDTDRTFAAAIVLLGRNVELTPPKFVLLLFQGIKAVLTYYSV